MRARITIAVVAILALALAIAGVVSAFLLRSEARATAQQTVLSQTQALVDSVKGQGKLRQLIAPQGAGSGQLLSEVLQLVQNVTTATTSDLLVTSNGGLLVPSPGSPVTSQQRAVLAGCGTVSGLAGGTAYAAVPLLCNLDSLPGSHASSGASASAGAAGGSGASASRSAAASAAAIPAVSTLAIVLTEPITYSADSVWYFLLAAAVALVVAGTVATLIARRISQHVVAAAGAAEAIASGDLDVRVPDSGGAYPELTALASAINTMAAGLARARALERQFLLNVSHDLRTPLTSIRGYSEAIADGAVPDPAAAASVVMAEAARLERLIRDLLDLAYLDAQRFSLHPGRLDLGAAVGAAAEALRYELETATVALEVRQPAEPLVVEADGDRLAQIVANLVENAGKYARSRVVVTVGREDPPNRRTAGRGSGSVVNGPVIGPAGAGDGATEGAPVATAAIPRRLPSGPTVALTVEDDGPGIAAEDLPHVFERLYTSDRTPSRAARGTGLGLAIVAELSSAMGGWASAASPIGPDGGTRMTVHLPLQEPVVPVAAAARA